MTHTDTIKAAFAAHLRTGAQLLTAWRAALPAERAAALAAFEEKGLRLGISLIRPADLWVAPVLLVDVAGGLEVLDTIELAGVSLAVN